MDGEGYYDVPADASYTDTEELDISAVHTVEELDILTTHTEEEPTISIADTSPVAGMMHSCFKEHRERLEKARSEVSFFSLKKR